MKNKENGITLIALIITIIVMLILVGVTINVVLNGGLFQKAKIASDQTQKKVSKEELISAMIGAYNSNGNFVVEDVVLPVGAKWCESSDTNYEEVETDQSQSTNCIITKENNKFYIDENGSVLEEPPSTNLWKQWGLTSENVVYGATYTAVQGEGFEGLYYFEMDGENGSVIVDEGTMTRTVMESMGTLTIGENYIILDMGSFAQAFVFNSSGAIIYVVNDLEYPTLSDIITEAQKDISESSANYTISE